VLKSDYDSACSPNKAVFSKAFIARSFARNEQSVVEARSCRVCHGLKDAGGQREGGVYVRAYVARRLE
jgi:hypothetical protein